MWWWHLAVFYRSEAFVNGEAVPSSRCDRERESARETSAQFPSQRERLVKGLRRGGWTPLPILLQRVQSGAHSIVCHRLMRRTKSETSSFERSLFPLTSLTIFVEAVRACDCAICFGTSSVGRFYPVQNAAGVATRMNSPGLCVRM